MNTEQARFNMIEQQIRPWNVLDSQVLQLLASVKREDFVPPAHKAMAFVDMEIPLLTSGEEALKNGLCMLAPRVEARLLQDLHVLKHEKVLEIGAGSGHMAALLGHRAQRVISLEIVPELAEMARKNLQKAGVFNVEVRHADGSKNLTVDGPFDVILLSGSVEKVPESLLALLKPGGRLAAIVGQAPMMRAHFITKGADGSLSTIQPWDTLASRLQGFGVASKFQF